MLSIKWSFFGHPTGISETAHIPQLVLSLILHPGLSAPRTLPFPSDWWPLWSTTCPYTPVNWLHLPCLQSPLSSVLGTGLSLRTTVRRVCSEILPPPPSWPWPQELPLFLPITSTDASWSPCSHPFAYLSSCPTHTRKPRAPSFCQVPQGMWEWQASVSWGAGSGRKIQGTSVSEIIRK